MRLQVDEHVAAPPADVFRFVATDHFHNHPTWDPAVVELTPTSAGPMGRGSTARLVRSERGRRIEGTVTVTGYEPDRTFAAVAEFGPFRLDQMATCTPAPDGGTRLALTIDTRASGPVRLALPLMRRRLRRTMRESLRSIKRSVEAGASA